MKSNGGNSSNADSKKKQTLDSKFFSRALGSLARPGKSKRSKGK